jgi:hypothetical protein
MGTIEQESKIVEAYRIESEPLLYQFYDDGTIWYDDFGGDEELGVIAGRVHLDGEHLYHNWKVRDKHRESDADQLSKATPVSRERLYELARAHLKYGFFGALNGIDVDDEPY